MFHLTFSNLKFKYHQNNCSVHSSTKYLLQVIGPSRRFMQEVYHIQCWRRWRIPGWKWWLMTVDPCCMTTIWFVRQKRVVPMNVFIGTMAKSCVKWTWRLCQGLEWWETKNASIILFQWLLCIGAMPAWAAQPAAGSRHFFDDYRLAASHWHYSRCSLCNKSMPGIKTVSVQVNTRPQYDDDC